MTLRLNVLIVFFFIGCTNPFAPKLVNENLTSSSFLTDLKNPQDVLTNFRYAYVFKDSLIYSELLDSSFTFISTNYATTPPSPITWGRDDDLRTTAKLFHHFRDISLTWGDTVNSRLDSSDAELKLIFTLTFDNGINVPTLKGEAKFNFIKKSGKWKIIRWEDFSSF